MWLLSGRLLYNAEGKEMHLEPWIVPLHVQQVTGRRKGNSYSIGKLYIYIYFLLPKQLLMRLSHLSSNNYYFSLCDLL